MKIPRVTVHAVLRYLQRVKRIDVEMVREHIAKTCAPAAAVGANCVRAEGVKFLLSREGVVTTTTPIGNGPNNTTMARLGKSA